MKLLDRFSQRGFFGIDRLARSLRAAAYRFVDAVIVRVGGIWGDESVHQVASLSVEGRRSYFLQLVEGNRALALTPGEGGRVGELKERFSFTNRYHQLPCTEGTRRRRVALIEELVGKEARVLLVGDDDHVGPALARAGFFKTVSIDCDARLIEVLRAEAGECSGRYVALQVDVLNGPPANLGEFDLVCVDPPYAREPLVAFSRFSAGFALGLGAIVLVMTNGLGVGEGALDALGDVLGAEGIGLAETRLALNVYPLNAFNRFFIALVGFLLVPYREFRGIRFAYFFSDCYVFRRRAEQGKP